MSCTCFGCCGTSGISKKTKNNHIDPFVINASYTVEQTNCSGGAIREQGKSFATEAEQFRQIIISKTSPRVINEQVTPVISQIGKGAVVKSSEKTNPEIGMYSGYLQQTSMENKNSTDQTQLKLCKSDTLIQDKYRDDIFTVAATEVVVRSSVTCKRYFFNKTISERLNSRFKTAEHVYIVAFERDVIYGVAQMMEPIQVRSYINSECVVEWLLVKKVALKNKLLEITGNTEFANMDWLPQDVGSEVLRWYDRECCEIKTAETSVVVLINRLAYDIDMHQVLIREPSSKLRGLNEHSESVHICFENKKQTEYCGMARVTQVTPRSAFLPTRLKYELYSMRSVPIINAVETESIGLDLKMVCTQSDARKVWKCFNLTFQGNSSLPEVDAAVSVEGQAGTSCGKGRLPEVDHKVHAQGQAWISDGKKISDTKENAGLKNLGNTCYMNCALQCLAMVNWSDDAYRFYSSQTDPLVKGFFTLMQRLATDRYAVSPYELKSAISRLSTRFASYRQQDSHEFLTFLLDSLDERIRGLNTQSKDHEGQKDPEKIKNPIADLTGVLESKTIMLCKHSDTVEQKFYSVSLPVDFQPLVCLDECFDHFTKEQKLDEEDQARCQICRKFVRCSIQLSFKTLPKILIIHLKKFDFSTYKKLDIDVKFQMEEKDYLWVPYSQGIKAYQLFGFCSHFGSLAGGHYTAMVRAPGFHQWYEYNDEGVRRVNESSVAADRRDAYLLFYQLDEKKTRELQSTK